MPIQTVSDLIKDNKNANKGTERGRKAVQESLRKLGAGRSIVVDRNGRIIAGNKTAEGAKAAGLEDVITVETDGSQLVAVVRTDLDLDDPKARELAIADNRTAELGLEWDGPVLKDLAADLDLKPYFTDEELQELLPPDPPQQNEKEEDHVPDVEDAVTQEGDLWQLGRHRLLCADGTQEQTLERLLNDSKIQMVFTDPPYGVEIVNVDGKVSTGLPPGPALRGKIGSDDGDGLRFARATGKVGGDKVFGTVGNNLNKTMRVKPIIEANKYAPIIGDDSTETAIKAYNLCATFKPAPVLIFWGGNYYASALPDSSCWIVWDKDNGQSFFADAELAWTNQKTAVRIFKHRWNGLIKASERGEKRCHPTQKPIALAEWCFEKYGSTGDNVLDLFGGSGSTLIACEKTSRTCYMTELSPHYVDVIIARWQKYTGKEAHRNSDGKSYQQVREEAQILKAASGKDAALNAERSEGFSNRSSC